jgi:hypothetical protein
MQLIWLDQSNPNWPAARRPIVDAFALAYDVEIARLPNRMLAVQAEDEALICAMGVRDNQSVFFSECYLDTPVDCAISAVMGLPVDRDDIIEFTALATVRAGAFGFLLSGLAPAGRAAGYRWGLFTATHPLRSAARRFGAPLAELGAANRDRAADPENWGTYYDHDPVVCPVDGSILNSSEYNRKRSSNRPALERSRLAVSA